jgi:hypothetical protein
MLRLLTGPIALLDRTKRYSSSQSGLLSSVAPPPRDPPCPLLYAVRRGTLRSTSPDKKKETRKEKTRQDK